MESTKHKAHKCKGVIGPIMRIDLANKRIKVQAKAVSIEEFNRSSDKVGKESNVIIVVVV